MSNTLRIALLGLLASSALAQTHGQTHSGHPMSMSMPAPARTGKPAPTLPLTVQKATIVAVPPSIGETSAFMTLRNAGKQPIRLVGVSATVAGQAMLMKTVKSANMSGMVGASSLVVPAGGSLTLNSDGDHVMLSGLKRALKPGEVLPLVLTDAAGRQLTVKATVKKP